MSDQKNQAVGGISAPRGFKISEVRPGGPVPAPEPPLGPLVHFVGRWAGNGFNTIFRPSQPATGSDNVLELNVTTESLDFSQSLGSIPNRGEVQPDIFLNGVPYLQTVNDVTTPGHSTGIHFEPGIWLSVPATTNPAVPTPSLTRMASIPHGTTILAQGTSATAAGPPTIPTVDITPFFIGQPANKVPFPSQTAANVSNFRIPSTLPVPGTTLTVADWQAMINDPNSVLRNIGGAQSILETITISIATNSANPLVGGGTQDIAFLVGNPAPNAIAVTMSATFYIETLSASLEIPARPPGHHHPVLVSPKALVPGQPVPTFRVTPKSHHATTIMVKYTQIQYSQLVLLNFAPLSWPHASVATLVPADPIDITAP